MENGSGEEEGCMEEGIGQQRGGSREQISKSLMKPVYEDCRVGTVQQYHNIKISSLANRLIYRHLYIDR